MYSSLVSPMTLDELAQQAPRSGSPNGTAALYYRIGNDPPVQVLTPFFQASSEPKSLVLWFYDPSVQPIPFVLFVAIERIYLGPGEYKGGASDIQVGFGIAGGNDLTWTAGTATASDLTTYFVPGGDTLIGSFSVQGLVPGPLFGPPDNPVPDQPTSEILFCFFSSETNGESETGGV